MRRLCLLLACVSLARAEDTLVDQLLELWPQPPEWWTHPVVVAFGRARAPADDAPLDDLLDYWSLEMAGTPSPRVGKRLLDACRAEPRRLALLWPALPRTRETVALARSWYETGADEEERRRLYGIEQLWKSDAEKIEDARTEAMGLGALAEEDWTKAEPIARELATRRTEIGATALGLLADRAEGGARAALERRLRALATDPAATAGARREAFDWLRRQDWPGRDAWYRALFRKQHDLPLAWMARDDPDRWIPEVARLVGDPDRAVHDNAVHCLAYFHNEDARADALRPLLPWLSDPDWATDRDNFRLRVVQSLDRIDLPECEPGVLKLLARADDSYLRRAAVQAARHYRFAAAAPRLRELGAWAAVRACETLGRDEQVEAVIAYARRGGGRLTGRQALGETFVRDPPDDPEVVAALVRRADDVPALAAILHRWSHPVAHAYLVRCIRAGAVAPEAIRDALERRARIRVHAADALRAAVEGGGEAAGIAAALLGDRSVLAGGDEGARRALLACAHLARIPLDLASVARLLPDPVAERYLSERREAAPYLPGRVVGAFPLPDFESWMRDLRARENARELYALLIGTEAEPEVLAVLIHEDRAVLKWFDNPARARVRTLAPGELDPLLDFIRRHRVEELPMLPHQAHDGVWYHYLHLTPRGGRRLYFNNPDVDERSAVYALFARRFERLREAPGFVRRYEAAAHVTGLAVLKTGGVAEIRDGAFGTWEGEWRSVRDGGEVDEPPPSGASGRLGPYGRAEVALGDRRVLHWKATDGISIVADGDRTWLVRGAAYHPVLTPDQRWLVYQAPDGVARLDLEQGRVFPSALPGKPVAYVSAHDAVLLDDGVLIDPATGRTREVEGDTWPLHAPGLQPTGRPHEYWAARDGVLGRYDAKRFRFTEVRRYPRLPFRTRETWVDEEAGHVYVAYRDDLLRLPLKKE